MRFWQEKVIRWFGEEKKTKYYIVILTGKYDFAVLS